MSIAEPLAGRFSGMGKLKNLLRRTPLWSTLRSVGQSRAAKLTTIAPFVGWLILLNARLTDFLALSPELFVGSGAADPGLVSKLFTLNSLYYTYIGLSIVGVASIIFIAMCPALIKQEASERSYVSEQMEVSTDAQIHNLAGIVAERYASMENLRNYELGRGSFFQLWDALISDMHMKGEIEFGSGTEFVTAMDTPIIDAITKEIAVNRRTSRAVVETFRASALSRRPDIYSMFYKSEDMSFVKTRMLIFVLYAFGFAILAVPTIRTFSKIVGLMVA